MKNHWIKIHNSLEFLIPKRCVSDKAANNLLKRFMSLSDTVIDSMVNLDFCGLTKDEVILECTLLCYSKLPRYEAAPIQGRPEVYFTIIIESYLHQMFRSKFNQGKNND